MSFLEKLRDEIIETQRIQASFARWKLLLISALGGAAIGIPPSTLQGESWTLLGLLPFVCLYADALAYNSGIRVLSIAQYLRARPGLEGDGLAQQPHGIDANDWTLARNYETFLKRHRVHFNLEVIALMGVSVGVSLVVCAMGFRHTVIIGALARDTGPILRSQDWWLVVTGALGVILSLALYWRHCQKVQLVDAAA